MRRLGFMSDAWGQVALEPGSWTDVAATLMAFLALFGLTGIAWLFSKKARARSALNRLGVEISDQSLIRHIEDHDDTAVELLLRAGIRPNVSVGGRTAVHVAIATKNKAALQALLKNGDADAVAAALLHKNEPLRPTLDTWPPGGEILASVEEVLNHLQRLIMTELDPEERTDVLNLGLDLEVVQTFLLYRLIFRKNFRNLKYRGLLVNANAELIGPVIDGGSSIHSGTAAAVVEKVNNQIVEHESLLERQNISIEIRSYDLPPVVHGFLIADSHLYLGFTEFSNDKLQGGQFAYLYMQHVKSDEMTAHLFRVYRSWFTYYWNRGTTLCRS